MYRFNFIRYSQYHTKRKNVLAQIDIPPYETENTNLDFVPDEFEPASPIRPSVVEVEPLGEALMGEAIAPLMLTEYGLKEQSFVDLEELQFPITIDSFEPPRFQDDN